MNRELPPNTLTNADGTPYAAGHESAIDQQKLKAHRYARAFTNKVGRQLYDKARSTTDRRIFEDFLEEQSEQFILAVLKDLDS